MFAPKTILIPTDFSKYSDQALQLALDIAKQYHSRVYLLHVIHLVIQCTEEYCLDPKTTGLLEKESMAAAKQMMEKQLNKFPDSKSVEVIADIRQGTPYEEILRDQKDKKVDLIVIASHGQTGFKRLFLGSVAERVGRESTCPVLLVKNFK
jgi:universal stress protein A